MGKARLAAARCPAFGPRCRNAHTWLPQYGCCIYAARTQCINQRNSSRCLAFTARSFQRGVCGYKDDFAVLAFAREAMPV